LVAGTPIAGLSPHLGRAPPAGSKARKPIPANPISRLGDGFYHRSSKIRPFTIAKTKKQNQERQEKGRSVRHRVIKNPREAVLQARRHFEPKVIVKQSRQAEYDRLAALPSWTRDPDVGKLSGGKSLCTRGDSATKLAR
jgi:hypothetical protein